MVGHNRKRFPSKSFRAKLRLLAFESRIAPAVFTVANANDSGAGSLRDALTQANMTIAADVINFDPNFFNTPRTISLLTALPNIAQDVSITGPGANLLTVRRDSAAARFRIFFVSIDGKLGSVTLSGMTLTGGLAPNSGLQPPSQIGGAIFNDENLTVVGCVVTGNSAPAGGGIATFSYGILTVRNSTVSGNVATGNFGYQGGFNGGGLYVGSYGSLTVSNSTISGNSTGASGGGIALRYDNTLLLEDSTVSGNTAAAFGGGLYSFGTTYFNGAFVIRNCTIANNSAPQGEGGGIELTRNGVPANGGAVTLQNITIAGNSARQGGGIALPSLDADLNLIATVIARNTDTDGNPDIYLQSGAGAINTTNSLVFDQTGLTLTGSGNLPAGTDPQFVGGSIPLLASNGGSVQTIALQAASPLIDAGLNAALSGVDARSNGFPRTVGSATDIGAFEFAAPGLPSALASAADVTSNGGTSDTFTVTYTDIAGSTVGMNTASLGNDDISVTGPNNFSANATLVGFTSGGGSITATYTIPVVGGWTSASYGAYRIAVNAGAVSDLDGNAVPAGAAGAIRVFTPATFTVTNLNDNGAGSLRQAIADANNRLLSPDTITFQAGLTGTINLGGGLTISDPVTVTGPGATSLTIAGNNTFRLLLIAIPGLGNVTLSGLTLTDGFITGDYRGGGALFTQPDNVVLDGVTVTGNSSQGFVGGGISVQRGATLTIRNSAISGNTSNNYGGGIGVLPGGALLLIENSTVAGNTAPSGGGIGDRGGSILTIRNSAISGNTAGTGGGGIFMHMRSSDGFNFVGDGGSALIENSTISGNTTNALQGGGFYFFGHTNPNGLVIRNSTISGNSAATSGGGIALNHLGGYAGYAPSTLLVQNSTIAGNTAGNGGGVADTANQSGITTIVSSVIANNAATTAPDLSGAINANFSLIRNQTGATITGSNNLPAGTDPLFIGGATPTLANNGGPTKTIAIQIASPLRDAGSNPANLTGDQRGSVGFVRNFGGSPDIGAYEFQPQAATVVNDGSVQRSRVTSLTVTFAGQVNFAGAVGAALSLIRVSDNAAMSFVATASTVNGVTQVVLNGFSGSATDFGSLADGRYTLTALSSQITLGGQALDGNGDGQAGGNYTFGDAQGLYRMFGDVNGDQVVNGLDLGSFRNAFGTQVVDPNYLSYLDFNGDGVINGFDLGQFRTRFGTVLP